MSWLSRIQAWVYPGSPAENAAKEYSDGRVIHVLKPEYYTVNENGTLIRRTVLNSGMNGYSISNARNIKAHSKEQYFTISSDAESLALLVGNTTKRTSAINKIKNFLDLTGFTGVDLDFEGFGDWSISTYTNYKKLLIDLGNKLHQYGYKLIVNGPPIGSLIEQNYYKWRYEDFERLPVDQICVMAYDYEYDYGAGKPVSPNSWVTSIINWVKGKISDIDRVIIGMPSYGYHGKNGSYDIRIDTKAQSKTYPGYSTATRDTSSHEMKWLNAGNFYNYQDSTGMNLKRKLIEGLGIKHISVWHLGGNDWFTGEEGS